MNWVQVLILILTFLQILFSPEVSVKFLAQIKFPLIIDRTGTVSTGVSQWRNVYNFALIECSCLTNDFSLVFVCWLFRVKIKTNSLEIVCCDKVKSNIFNWNLQIITCSMQQMTELRPVSELLREIGRNSFNKTLLYKTFKTSCPFVDLSGVWWFDFIQLENLQIFLE